SALVAVLACASLLAVSHYAAARTTHGGKSSSAATAKAAGKTAKSSGKKAAARKSKDDKSASKSAVPQIPLAPGPAPETSEAEIARVKSAIETLRHGGASKATEVAGTISDPVARKLVEWMILRSEHSGAESKRFLAFIAANPSWPNLGMFRKRAEAMLWNENPKPPQVLSFFKDSPPQSGMGRLVLARALIAQGDTEAAKPLIREAWRDHSLSAAAEKQVLERYSEFLARADHKARMEKRVIAADNEAALRAARRLGAADVAIAQARIAINRKGANVKKLLDAVPADARHDPDYLLVKAYVLRHDNKIAEATQVLLSAPCDLDEIHDGEEWWVERRIMARKLLDLGDARSAYRVVAEGAEPTKENSRIERHFMAGRAAPRGLRRRATPLKAYPGLPPPSHLVRSLPLLARPRGGSFATAGAGTRRVRNGSAGFGRLLRAARPRPARASGARPGGAAAQAGQGGRGATARARPRARDPLRTRRTQVGHLADGQQRGVAPRHGYVVGAGRIGAAIRGRAWDAAYGQGCARTRLAARLLRVPDRRRAALFADRPQHREGDAVCDHSPRERVRSVRLVECAGDGPDAGDAGSRKG